MASPPPYALQADRNPDGWIRKVTLERAGVPRGTIEFTRGEGWMPHRIAVIQRTLEILATDEAAIAAEGKGLDYLLTMSDIDGTRIQREYVIEGLLCIAQNLGVKIEVI